MFFDLPGLTNDDITAYEGTFRNKLRHSDRTKERVLVDFSPPYLWVPYVPARIAKLWPGTKLVFLLRWVAARGVALGKCLKLGGCCGGW